MNYFSTRDKSLNLSFKDIFLRGLAPGGGLFLPAKIKKYNQEDLNDLSQLNYNELATEIIFNFCSDEIKKNELSSLIQKSYSRFKDKEVVSLKKIGSINLLELYHGPTLAFKDIAMQVIGNMYDHLQIAKDKTVNIVVATSGDTGSAAIAALSNRKNINLFVLHPHNKISNIQRKIMTTIGGANIYNIAIEGSFDDCQNIVKKLFNEDSFRTKINMSGVNSINWARIVCQIVYYFYSFFKLKKNNVNFSVPTGNFGDIFAGYMAKKMGLPINKLIVATNKNDILQRIINTGEYKPDTVQSTITPSMDIQVASNFERLLYFILDENDSKVGSLMNDLSSKGLFNLEKKEIDKIKKDFEAAKVTDDETVSIIDEIYKDHKFIIDPHTATGIVAAKSFKNLGNIIVLGTAHPYKFSDTIKKAIGKNLVSPEHLKLNVDKKEKFDVINNSNSEVKNYILSKLQ
tara:strand:+ start:5644 stop:7020 length:1377 start_codon:yes stop_codon:yes gene_type:complete